MALKDACQHSGGVMDLENLLRPWAYVDTAWAEYCQPFMTSAELWDLIAAQSADFLV